MSLDLRTFKIIEVVGWIVAYCVLFFLSIHVAAFLILCVVVRKFYMLYKLNTLGLVDTKDKTVVVTGCDTGFGLGLAKRLYDKGFTVFATCLNPDCEGGKSLQSVNSERLRVIQLDVSSDDQVARCLKLVREECGHKGLWGLVNNAGLNTVGDVELTTMEQYLKVCNINLFGMVRMTKAFLPLIRQAKGRVVNVTSMKGLAALPGCAAYNMTKFGGEAFSDTLRIEMSQYGVTVVIVEPCNYGGATGCLSEAALKRMKADFDDMWSEASDEVKEFYGQAHIEQSLEECRKLANIAAPSIDPVLDAFEDALRNPCPQVRYLIKGSNSFFDSSHVLALLVPYTPQTLFDKLRAYFLPYVIHK